jgi:hypothetical protein
MNAAAGALAVLGCAGDITGPRASVTLTASQAAMLVDKAHLIASSRSELAWLADSIEVVLRAGAEARLISIARDGVVQTFYAVGLIRQFAGANPFSTFHLIGFDVADNPSSFILANGYSPGVDGTPASQVTGSFGDGSVFAHLVHLSGTQVDALTAIVGEAAFVLGDLSAGCAGNVSVACYATSLVANFRIDDARSDQSPAKVHNVTQTHVNVPGILLVFNQAPPQRP